MNVKVTGKTYIAETKNKSICNLMSSENRTLKSLLKSEQR